MFSRIRLKEDPSNKNFYRIVQTNTFGNVSHYHLEEKEFVCPSSYNYDYYDFFGEKQKMIHDYKGFLKESWLIDKKELLLDVFQKEFPNHGKTMFYMLFFCTLLSVIVVITLGLLYLIYNFPILLTTPFIYIFEKIAFSKHWKKETE